MNNIQALNKFGLNQKEAKTYLVLLELIEAPVYRIAQCTGIARATTYGILEQLQAQGIVMSFKKNGVMHFTAESPKRLITIAEEKAAAIEAVLPQLQQLVDENSHTPIVKMYSGSKAIRIAKDDILETLRLKKQKQLHVIANEDIFLALPKYFPRWISKRVAAKIHAKIILPDSAKNDAKFTAAENTKKMREVRFLPPDLEHNISVNIYANKISIFIFDDKDPSALIISSPIISHFFQQFFEMNWKLLADRSNA